MVREYKDKFLETTSSAVTDDAAAPQTVLPAALLGEQKPQIESTIADTYRKRGVQWFSFAGGKIRSIEEFVADYPGA